MRLVHFGMEWFLNSKSITRLLRVPVSRPFLVALQQCRWKLSRVIGNCIPMRKRHCSHAFRLKSGKHEKSEIDGWCFMCGLPTSDDFRRGKRNQVLRGWTTCWSMFIYFWREVDLFTWIEPDLSSTRRELIQQLKHRLCFWGWCKECRLQQF